ncbi:hypothetical protein [Methylocystis sp.]|uniref:esterase/lipase family protein n=1 Tax=Methylocystis sp. TaxID=1911079 RepID=UPI0025E97815|nr:hypothetical protein [Methylocystis sp.]
MEALIFVPGIMGTELIASNGDKLWPPTPEETIFGYRRVNELLKEDVQHGDIIQTVSCFDVYAPLFDQFNALGFVPNGEKMRRYPFPYDWRQDLDLTAKKLAGLLERVDQAGASALHLVAHSMGGLISRLVLETEIYAPESLRKKVTTFIALATPHQGAPLALARALGLDSALGISASDFRKIANDRRYPAGYQLLPAPNEAACWDKRDLAVGVIDIYDKDKAERLGLNLELLDRARFVQDSLAKGAPPEDTRYFYFAGTGHETVTRINVSEVNGVFPIEQMVVTRTEDAGDGTVPFWSALPRAVQKQVVVNEHSKVFNGMPFKRVFYRLLGGDLGVPLESLAREEEAPSIRLSLATPVIQLGRAFEILVVPGAPVPEITGSLTLQKLDDKGQPEAGRPAEQISALTYKGPRVSRLRLLSPAIGTRGFYEIVFRGQPANSDPLRFAVVSFRP